jgi:hypothetical protein
MARKADLRSQRTGVKRWLAVVGCAAVVTFVLIALAPAPAGADTVGHPPVQWFCLVN